MATAAPGFSVACQGDQVGKSDVLLRPAKRFGHRPGHSHHERRIGEARRRRRDERAQMTLGTMLLEQEQPTLRGRGPHGRAGSVTRAVPIASQCILRIAGSHQVDAHVHTTEADPRRGGVVVARDLGEQRGLLLRRGDDEGDAPRVAHRDERLHRDREGQGDHQSPTIGHARYLHAPPASGRLTPAPSPPALKQANARLS